MDKRIPPWKGTRCSCSGRSSGTQQLHPEGRTHKKWELGSEPAVVCARSQQNYSRSQKVEKPSCPSKEERTVKTWSTQTAQQYPTVKRNGILLHATLWEKPKNMLNEGSQTQRPHTTRFSMYAMSATGKSRDGMRTAGGLGLVVGECFTGTSVLLEC